MIFSIEVIEALEELEPSTKQAIVKLLKALDKSIGQMVRREDFLELKAVVAELAQKVNALAEAQRRTEEAQRETQQQIKELTEAQKKTEERLNELAEVQKETNQKVKELAEAQKKTEQRLNELAEAQKETDRKVKELAEAQKKTEQRLNELAEAQKETDRKVKELAEAQKKTEQRLNELAEAQKRTEQRLDEFQRNTEENFQQVWKAIRELTEAQKRTEEELRKLTEEHRKTREQLGGLSHTVGYILEDRSYVGLPPLLERDFNIKIKEPLRRDWIEVGPGRFIEVNIIGKAEKDGKEIWIVGECKTQLKKKDIDEFLRHLRGMEAYLGGERLPVIVTYQTRPPVRQYAEDKGIHVYFSYQMPL